MNLIGPLWRAVAVFRIAALGYAGALLVGHWRDYDHLLVGLLVLAAMAVWTAVATAGYRMPRWRSWPLLSADLGVAAGSLIASAWVIRGDELRAGAATLPMAWIAAPVVAWGIVGGRRLGAVAALLLGGCDVAIRGGVNDVTINGTVLLLLVGVVIGHASRLAVTVERRLQLATEREAATRERERLARGIHDSVLQVLALVQRRAAELGGEAAELGRLAGEQEVTLRALVAASTVFGGGSDDLNPDGVVEQRPDTVDLRTVISAHAAPTVSIVTPATAVPLTRSVAAEIGAAVGAALDNVRMHCEPGTRAWVLVEDETRLVTVTVRDDGLGIAPGRLSEAAHAGRLGVAQSIRGRIRELGGGVRITARPGEGTEVEISVPRQPVRPSVRPSGRPPVRSSKENQ